MYLKNKTVVDQRLVLDGASLLGSKFRRCTFIYSGLLPAIIVDCEFHDCNWEFAGPAKEALGFLGAMYALGGAAAELVENTFNNITKKGPATGGPTLH
jgi:hypothetical protein